jgi:hypothetical protein
VGAATGAAGGVGGAGGVGAAGGGVGAAGAGSLAGCSPWAPDAARERVVFRGSVIDLTSGRGMTRRIAGPSPAASDPTLSRGARHSTGSSVPWRCATTIPSRGEGGQVLTGDEQGVPGWWSGDHRMVQRWVRGRMRRRMAMRIVPAGAAVIQAGGWDGATDSSPYGPARRPVSHLPEKRPGYPGRRAIILMDGARRAPRSCVLGASTSVSPPALAAGPCDTPPHGSEEEGRGWPSTPRPAA